MSSNYIQGGFGGLMPGQYVVAGGPYIAAIQQAVESNITALLNVYSLRRDADNPNTIVRRLEYSKNLIEYNYSVDGEGHVAVTVIPAHRPFRLPDGYLADTYEVEVIANNVTIHEIFLASTMEELALL
jgi:hypothetical protein